MIELILKDIQDQYVRENFWRILKFFQKDPLLKGEWTFFDLKFDSAVTSRKIPHGLGFKPLDVIQTSLTGPGTLTWEYDNFDTSYLVVTTSGPCKVRAFIGAYREG